MRNLFFVLAAGLASSAIASEPLEIVISPTKTPMPQNKVGSSVSVITADDLNGYGQTGALSALESVPGITVSRSGGYGNPASVFIRGAESRHTLVFIDGIKMNDPGNPVGSFDFGHLDAGEIERIEILRGAESTLYGSDAIGGVINIITKSPSSSPKASVSAEAGSYKTVSGNAAVSGGYNGVGYRLSASSARSSGFSALAAGSEDDGYKRNSLDGRLTAKISDQFSNDALFSVSRAETEFDSNVGISFAPLWEYENEDDFRESRFSDRFKWKSADGGMEQQFGFQILENARDNVDGYLGEYDAKSARRKFDWQGNFKLPGNNLATFGLEAEKESFSSDYLFIDADTETESAYIQDVYQAGAFSVASGARLDHHKAFGNHATYRVAPVYNFPGGTTLRGSIGTGFKAPSLSQLYAYYGNPNLDPEKSVSYDIGVEQEALQGKLRGGLTLFRNDLSNLIDYSLDYFGYYNIGKAKTYGAESFVSYSPFSWLTLNANYTYTLAEDTVNDQALLRRPKHKAYLSAIYTPRENLRLKAESVYNGGRSDYDLDFNRAKNSGANVINLSASYRLSPAVELTARVDNLLDKRYEEVMTYNTAGISGYAGVKVELY